jgi:hypothetical protein
MCADGSGRDFCFSGNAVAGAHRGAGAPSSLCETVVLLDANQIGLPDGSDGL